MAVTQHYTSYAVSNIAKCYKQAPQPEKWRSGIELLKGTGESAVEFMHKYVLMYGLVDQTAWNL